MSRQEIEKTTLEFVARLETVADTESAMGLFQGYASGLGYTFATCLRMPEVGEELTDCLQFCNYPKEWVERYADKGYVRHDPIVRELFQTYQPFTWTDVRARRKIRREGIAVMQEAAELGAREGFVVPIYEAGGYTGLVSLAGSEVMSSEEARNGLTLACVYLHNKLSTLRRQQTDITIGLTDRELECLSWAAAGKSDWEIGQILSVSSKTVNYHIENAKRKFGVTTRIQAIISAMRTGKLAQ